MLYIATSVLTFKETKHNCVSDFVIYLGDVITANNIMIANASLYWDQATSPTRVRGIPWASVFGNHDDAPFEWPLEWFSARGIPQLSCPMVNSSYSGEYTILNENVSYTKFISLKT